MKNQMAIGLQADLHQAPVASHVAVSSRSGSLMQETQAMMCKHLSNAPVIRGVQLAAETLALTISLRSSPCLAVNLDAVTATIDDVKPPLLIDLDGGGPPEKSFDARRLLTQVIGS